MARTATKRAIAQKEKSETEREDSSAEDKELEEIKQMLAQALDECQNNYAHHPKWQKILLSRFENQPLVFVRALVPLLNRILTFSGSSASNAAIARVVDFICKFAISRTDKEEVDGEMFVFLVKYILTFSNAKEKVVRERICDFLARMLSLLDGEAEIDVELFELIANVAIERSFDKISAIRAKSALILSRLQDPGNEDDIVLLRLKEMMNVDTSKEVRINALKFIGCSQYTYSDIVLRTKDVSFEVRRAAFETVRNRIEMKALSISDRVNIIITGLNDKNEDVVLCTEGLLWEWWFNQCAKDIVKFVNAFDVESSEKEVICIVSKLYELILNNEEFTVEDRGKLLLSVAFETIVDKYGDDEVLDAIFALNLLCGSFSSRLDVDLLDMLIPSALNYCTFLRNCHSLTALSLFEWKTVVELSQHLDRHDEAGCKELYAVFNELWRDENEKFASVLEVISPVMIKALVNLERFEWILDIVSNFCSQDTVELNPNQISRFLSISAGILSEAYKMKSFVPQAILVIDQVIKLIANPVEQLRRIATRVSCLHVLTSKDTSTAISLIPLLHKLFISDSSASIQEECLKCIFDLSLSFRLFKDQQIPEPEIQYTLGALKKELECQQLIDEDKCLVYMVLLEGFSKLLFHDSLPVCESEEILGLLILFLFDTETETQVSMRNFLSVFLPNFSFSKDNSRMLLSRAYTFCLFNCMYVNAGSPRWQIDWKSLSFYIGYLLSIDRQDKSLKVDDFNSMQMFFFEFVCFEIACFNLLNAVHDHLWELFIQLPLNPSPTFNFIFTSLVDKEMMLALSEGVSLELSKLTSSKGPGELDDDEIKFSEIKTLLNTRIKFHEDKLNPLADKFKRRQKKEASQSSRQQNWAVHFPSVLNSKSQASSCERSDVEEFDEDSDS